MKYHQRMLPTNDPIEKTLNTIDLFFSEVIDLDQDMFPCPEFNVEGIRRLRKESRTYRAAIVFMQLFRIAENDASKVSIVPLFRFRYLATFSQEERVGAGNEMGAAVEHMAELVEMIGNHSGFDWAQRWLASCDCKSTNPATLFMIYDAWASYWISIAKMCDELCASGAI